MTKKIYCVILLALALLLFQKPALAVYQLEKSQLASEIAAAGIRIVGEADYFGVPCLEIELPMNQAIFEICRRIPSLNVRYFETREAIAIVNGLNPFFSRSHQNRPFDTKKETILIPLNTNIQPNIFPANDADYVCYGQLILVDREKQMLAYYEKGFLIACFPVSTGKPGKGTPPMKGWIGLKDENHVSSIYDVLMPFSLLLVRPYFIHAGVMPGMPDSAGCIRMFTEHAKWLFERIGTQKTFFEIR